jgi:hypothetical protein
VMRKIHTRQIHLHRTCPPQEQQHQPAFDPWASVKGYWRRIGPGVGDRFVFSLNEAHLAPPLLVRRIVDVR